MKININKILIAFAVFLLVGLSGCLKEKYEDGAIQPTHSTGGTPSVVEIGLTATSTENFYLLAVDNSDVDTTVNFIPVKLAASNAAPEDIHVTLTLDPTQIDDYNTANGTQYELAPESKYTIISSVVTIPKGSHAGYLQLKFKPSNFIGHEYALAFKISSIQETSYVISGNFSKGISAVTIKNEYDGTYTGSGARIRYSGGTEASGVRDSFAVEGSINYGTLNANTIAGQLADDGSGFTMALQVINTGTPPYVVNVLPDPSAAPENTPSSIIAGTARGSSSYDPGTRTFTLHFGYLNASGALRQVNEVLVKK